MGHLVGVPVDDVVALAAAVRAHLQAHGEVVGLVEGEAVGGHGRDHHAHHVAEGVDGAGLLLPAGGGGRVGGDDQTHPAQEGAFVVGVLRLGALDEDLGGDVLLAQLGGHRLQGRDDAPLHGIAGLVGGHGVEGVDQALAPGRLLQARGRAVETEGAVAVGEGQGLVVGVLGAQGPPQGVHDEDEHPGEGQRHDDGGLLQDGDASGHEHGDGKDPGQGGPEDPQPGGGVLARRADAAGEVGHDQGAGVGAGDVEEDPDEQGQCDEDLLARQVLQHPVQALLGLVQGDVAELAVAANDQVQGVVAEDGHPHEDVAEGQQEAAEHELTDGAAARDTGQEHAHEGGPRDPPGPEEQGPGVEPLIGPVVGVGLQREPWEAGEEVADGAHECVDEEGGVTGDEHPQGQADGQQHVDGGQDAHAPVDAGDGRDGGHDDGQGGQPDLGGEALRQPEQDAEGHVQLDDADPQRGRDAEDPADQRRGVDDVADDALGVPAQQRAQG